MSLFYDNKDYISLNFVIDELVRFKLNVENIKMILDLASCLNNCDLNSFTYYYKNVLFSQGKGRGFFKKGFAFLGNKYKTLWLKKRLERVSHRKVSIKDKRF